MLKVFIADDEDIVRQGLKNIIDWKELGYQICGEAGDGLTAYNQIRKLQPDLILLDINMPKLQGLDLASQLREIGYEGHIIVLTGYSEFKYAQKAIEYDIEAYLTKPIDEELLEEYVMKIREKVVTNRINDETLCYYKEKAKDKILKEILFGKKALDSPYSLKEMNLEADQYQVVIMEEIANQSSSYHKLLTALQLPANTIFVDAVEENGYRIVLLKGELVIRRFSEFCRTQDQKELQYTLSVGPVVDCLDDIHSSLLFAEKVLKRMFFVGGVSKIVTSKMELTIDPDIVYKVNDSKVLGSQLYDLLVVFRKQECLKFLDDLLERVMISNNDSDDIKSVLAGMYIYLITQIKRSYASYEPEFMTNAEIIKTLYHIKYLHEVIAFFKKEIHRIHQLIGGMSSDGVLDEIVEYIKHNYHEDIKLKKLAPKFGYNSSYLGKIFTKKLSISFNDFLHQVRIEEAKRLLLESNYRVYEIAIILGYKNVDYFHLRFKQFVETTPNEYRLSHHVKVEDADE